MALNFPKHIAIASSLAMSILIGGWISPSWAGDPFRTTNPRNIGDKTEAAFNTLFKKGDYKEAKKELDEATQAEPNEPLAYAMRASLAYTEGDWESVKTDGSKTTEAANRIKEQDPVRGNLYLAVGTFLEGTYVFQKEGPIPAISRLQQVFNYIEVAEKASPQDPELNLVKGYLDLMLAVNLPFASADEAINRFQKYAAPSFLVDRGIAMGYRDLQKYDLALQYMDKALQVTPDNPELQYLKGQLLRLQGNKSKNPEMLKQALVYFNQALEKEGQLPAPVLKQLKREQRKVNEEIQQMGASASK